MRRRTLLAMSALAPVLGAGEARANAAASIGSVKFRTWVWPTPERSKNHIALGAIRVGTRVALESASPVSGSKWFAVKPFGYVFADDTTTFDFDSTYFRALASLAPSAAAPYPYRYAYSMGAPMYSRVPTRVEQEQAELELGAARTFRHLGGWAKSHEVLVRTDGVITPTDPQPRFLKGHAPIEGSPWNPANPKVKVVPAGSGVAYAKAFAAAGRVWLLTPDLLLVPADRVFAYRRSNFQGVALDGRTRLPLAWIRGAHADKLQARGEHLVASGKRWPNKSHVALSGKVRQRDDKRWWQTRDRQWWIEERLDNSSPVSVIETEKQLRFGIGTSERWLLASITKGTMVAYEGLTPKWCTLWSGGKGGVPVSGNDPKKHATTEVGVFPIEWKDRIATMSPDPGAPTVFWFPDVPHIQYVHAPLALHVTYWHDNFGNLMSAECLNVSPEDGRWLFDFTLPALPAGWNSVRPHTLTGASTKVRIVP